MSVSIQETYSSKVVNYVEPYEIGGVTYTKFFTEVNTDLNVGDYVYILNGNYDNSDIIEQNEYQYAATGYKVLAIEKNALILNVEYRLETPWNEDLFEEYTKVYLVNDLDKFNYENIDNSFGFEIYTGEKYSSLNNNIFLSQIENLPYTSETQTKDKFFKSYNFDGNPLTMIESRGQLFDDSTELKFQLEEVEEYGVGANGKTGSTTLQFSAGYNVVADFDLIKQEFVGYEKDKLIVLTSENIFNHTKLWSLDKRSVTLQHYDKVVMNTHETSPLAAHLLTPFDNGDYNLFPNKDYIELRMPPNLNGEYKFTELGTGITQSYNITQGIQQPYYCEGMGDTIILGYSEVNIDNNFRTFGFYHSGYMSVVPNPDSNVTIFSTIPSNGYHVAGANNTPYFTLMGDSGNLPPYTQQHYFPVTINGNQVNIVPEYAKFTGIGSPVKTEVNQWVNVYDDTNNLEMAFAASINEPSSPFTTQQGGLYFYNYTGNYENISTGEKFIGNALEINYDTFIKYQTGSWSQSIFSPFPESFDYRSFNFINDIQFIGIEKKNLKLNLGLASGGSQIIDSETGIWYSKYLLINELGEKWYVYLNFNGDLIRTNNSFNLEVNVYGIPQVHCVIEPIENSTSGSVIGYNRTNPSDVTPDILNGEYPIGSILGGVEKFAVNEDFDKVNFASLSVTSFDYEDNRWLISTAAHSSRTLYASVGIAKGLYIYDMSVGSFASELIVDTNTSFTIGDMLPSNNIYKTRSEIINGKRRVWAATDLGLFMLDYNLDYNYDYYYSIDFDNNEIPLNENLFKNNKLYIMEDFEYDGIQYNKGDVCKYISSEKRWEVDSTYLKTYISKSHFSNGSFLNGNFNDGILGNRKTKAEWSGAKWRNGVLYNSIWNSGIMESKSDDLISQSYYSSIKNGNINTTTDFTNNKGYGYNNIIKSVIKTGIINNGNFDFSTIGENAVSTYVDNTAFSDITINKGYFLNSVINSVEMKNSKIELSNFNSSYIGGNSMVINSDGFNSILSDAKIENKGSIKVIGYDKWYNLRNSLTETNVIQIHKFFISEEDFKLLEFKDWVIFNNVEINTPDPTNILDKIYHVLGGVDGYYEDVYEDLNKITNSKYNTNQFKVFISKKLNTQNTRKSVIDFNGSNIEVKSVSNNNPQYSIDLAIVSDNIPHGSEANVYLTAIEDNGILKFSGININNSTIQINHFKHCLISGGEWLNGSSINFNQLSNQFNYGSVSTVDNGGTISVVFDLNEDFYEVKSSDILSLGSLVSLNNIWDTNFNTNVSGDYTVQSFGTNSITLLPNIPITLAGSVSLTSPISQYMYIHLNKFDGSNNNLKLSGGLFKAHGFNNLSFNNQDIELNNITFNNTRKLLIINSEITNVNNITIENGFFGYGQISSDFTGNMTEAKLLAYKQVLNHVNILDGYVTKSAFLNGTFTNGQFINNKYTKDDDLLPTNNTNYVTAKTAIIPSFHGGIFVNGLFNNSVWLNGTFKNGKFLNSEFLNGNWENGIFGDISTKTTRNAFRKGHWYNGIFENGIFSDNINHIQKINTVYTTSNYILNDNYYIKDGTNIWENGNFNNGVFTSIDDNVSIWNDGNFNNGLIENSVIWNDGVFNNGKFKSTYGRFVSTVWGEANLFISGSFSSLDGFRASNLKQYYTTDLSFINKYNLGTFRDIHIDGQEKVFDNPATLVLDTSDYQLKYTIIGSNHTNSYDDPFETNSTSHGYGEKMISDFYDNPTIDLSLQFRPINNTVDETPHPLVDSNVLGAKIYVQNSGNEYIYNGSQYITAATFLGATISGTNVTYNTIYAWRDGVFNNGEFGDPLNRGNANPSWANGTFNGGKFYGKVWKDGVFIKGDFNGVGVNQKLESETDIFKGYNPQATIEEYIDDFSNVIIGTNSILQTNYKNILDKHKWFGLWLDGTVSPNINEFYASDRIQQNAIKSYFETSKYGRRKSTNVNFNNMLWVNGNFNNPDGNMNKSIWLSGQMNNGQFNDSMFNPYVQRWDFESGGINNLKFSFELNNCVWNNGTFNNGVFYYSDWNNGVFKYGSMVGGKFMKGRADYISNFSTIWVDGRHRNGNWYGSNFTVENKYNDPSVPNPFEYLGNYFSGNTYPPFMLDILSNNTSRIQDDRLHVWNMMGGTQSINPYELTGHDFGVDEDNRFVSTLSGSVGIYTIRLEDQSTNLIVGEMELKFSIYSSLSLSTNFIFNSDVTDVANIDTGSYIIDFYTNGGNSFTFPPNISNFEFKLNADVYKDGLLTQSNLLIKKISGISGLTKISQNILIPLDTEYKLKISITGLSNGVAIPSHIFNMDVRKAIGDIFYLEDNNTLNGYIETNYSSDYLDSAIVTISGTQAYINEVGTIKELEYYGYDVSSMNIPLGLTSTDGAYAQFGNGIFMKGIWENGVWNNGYRGVQYGTNISTSLLDSNIPETSFGEFTYASGATASVLLNSLYPTYNRYAYRTEPIIYFNNVQRSFKTSKNRWRMVLESALVIDAENRESYNRLSLGDKVTVGNIIAIDINGNRKLIKDMFTVVDVPLSNRITLEYQETFPIDDIQVDSDRHLIYVTKNIWLGGAYLNGYFEGIMNSGFIKGNRAVTKIKDSHLIDVQFDGGHLIGAKFGLTHSFDSNYQIAISLSPQFNEKYGGLYHSTVVQNMDFNDSVTLATFSMYSPIGLTVSGNPLANSDPNASTKLIQFSSVNAEKAIQYIYNSDIDVVYEPEYFSNLFNQNIFNSHNLNKAIISPSENTKLYNIPAGYITYDILSSNSKFTYAKKPDSIEKGVFNFNLSLGSKYKKYNDIFNADYTESPNNNINIDIPSTFNVVDSGTYGISYRDFNSTGATFEADKSQFLHDEFMYVYGTSSARRIITGDNTFKIKGRYHMVEVDVEFKKDSILNPFDISKVINLDTSFTYSTVSLPKLSIGQTYNESYEIVGGTGGYLSSYDNDVIPFIDGRKLSEINNFGKLTERITIRGFMHNNFGGYRNSVNIIEKDFDKAIGSTNSNFDIHSPVYYNFRHYELDQIPFYNYKDYIDPLTGTISEWNMTFTDGANQHQTRMVDNRVKVPFYATAVPIVYSDDSFVLSDNINFFGGTNIKSNTVVDISLFSLNNKKFTNFNTIIASASFGI